MIGKKTARMMKRTIAAQNDDDQRLNQVAQVRDHDRDLLVVVVRQVGEALRQLAGLFSRGDDGDHIGSELPRVVEDSAQLSCRR